MFLVIAGSGCFITLFSASAFLLMFELKPLVGRSLVVDIITQSYVSRQEVTIESSMQQLSLAFNPMQKILAEL